MTITNFPTTTKILKVLGWLALILFILSFIIALIFGFPIKQTLRVIFGAIYVLFVPGFIWSYVFFGRHPERRAEGEESKDPPANQRVASLEPAMSKAEEAQDDTKNKSPLDLIERITLSFALSMAMGPLLIFFLNKIGVKINLINSFLEIFGLIIIGLVIIFIQERKIGNSRL